jgi:hypothetical protein
MFNIFVYRDTHRHDIDPASLIFVCLFVVVGFFLLKIKENTAT